VRVTPAVSNTGREHLRQENDPFAVGNNIKLPLCCEAGAPLKLHPTSALLSCPPPNYWDSQALPAEVSMLNTHFPGSNSVIPNGMCIYTRNNRIVF